MQNYQNDDDDRGKSSGNGFVKKLRRGGRRITLKYSGTCADCGAFLPVGATARWYGRGRVYGLTCHANSAETAKPKTSQVEMDFEKREREAVEADFDPAEVEPWENEGGKTYDCTIH